MNTRSFSDDLPPPLASSRRQRLKSHAPIAVVILAMLTLAIGVHVAATTLVVVAGGHLLVVGAFVASARIRRRSTRGAR